MRTPDLQQRALVAVALATAFMGFGGSIAQASPARPFAPPTTARTVHISSGIDATGATNVRSVLTSAIAAAPNGSVISFPAGGVYRIDGGLEIGDRHDLVLDGNGSTLRIGASGAGPSNTLIDIWANSTDIAIRDFKLVGNSPKPGGLIDGQEFAMGIHVDIASRVEIDDVTIRAVYGDALAVDSWGRDIWFHDSHVVSAGKNGVGILAGRNVIVERNTFDKVGLHPFNIEPYERSGGGVKIRFRQNTIGTYGTKGSDAGQWAVMFTAHGIPGNTIEDVRVSGNTVRQRSIQSQVTSTTRPRWIVVTNNRSLVAQAPYYNSPAVLSFAHVDGLTVFGNTQPLTQGSLVAVADCTSVDRG